MPGGHVYASRAQMRWANATRQPFAHRWNEATERAGRSKRLPARRHAPGTARTRLRNHRG